MDVFGGVKRLALLTHDTRFQTIAGLPYRGQGLDAHVEAPGEEHHHRHGVSEHGGYLRGGGDGADFVVVGVVVVGRW